MTQIKKLEEELQRLLEAEERLLDFLIYNPEHKDEAVKKIFEVSELILQIRRIISELKKNPDRGD